MHGDIKELIPPISSTLRITEDFNIACEPSMMDLLLVEAREAIRVGQIRYAMRILEQLQEP